MLSKSFLSSKNLPRCPQEPPKNLPRCSQDAPSNLQDGPKSSQDRPTSLQDHQKSSRQALQTSQKTPKKLQEASKRVPGDLQAAQEAPKRLPREPQDIPKSFPKISRKASRGSLEASSNLRPSYKYPNILISPCRGIQTSQDLPSQTRVGGLREAFTIDTPRKRMGKRSNISNLV